LENKKYDLEKAKDDQQAKQIEALKEKLIDERAKMFHQFGDMELDATESDRQQARQLLAEEMPEVDWE
jgi:hypothetical protein